MDFSRNISHNSNSQRKQNIIIPISQSIDICQLAINFLSSNDRFIMNDIAFRNNGIAEILRPGVTSNLFSKESTSLSQPSLTLQTRKLKSSLLSTEKGLLLEY